MTKVPSLPLDDVRQVFHIVTECRALGDDSFRWRQHMLVRATELIGARVGLSGEAPSVPFAEYCGVVQVQFGWANEAEAQRCHEFWSTKLPSSSFVQRATADIGPVATFTRQPYLGDDEWYALPEVQEVLRPSNVDGMIISRRLCGNLPGWGDGLMLLFAWEQQPSERDRQLVQLLHDEVAPLVGGPLATRAEAAPSDLPHRKQQILEWLLLGATDKQIAASLHIARPTASEYVSDVLRHFNVKSRTELLAAFLKRYRPSRGVQLT
jgi:DNA-binding CsgD family transcriptional regulator